MHLYLSKIGMAQRKRSDMDASPPGTHAARILSGNTFFNKLCKRMRHVLAAASMFGAGIAQAEMPERGLYWQPALPHQGYYIEHQNNTAVLIVFAYDEQGHAEWFSASGPLKVGTTLNTEMSDQSLHHYFTAPLARLKNGPVLGFPEYLPNSVAVPTAEVIGTATVNFSPTSSVFLDLESTLPGGPLRRVESVLLSRFNFGFGGYGQNQFPSHDRCWPNLEGEWLFMDRSQRARPAWRFKFTNVSVRAWDPARQLWLDGSVMSCGFTYQPHEIIYRDEVANADLRCASTEGGPPPDFPSQAHACEIIDRNSGQTLFWFLAGSNTAHNNRALGHFGTPRDADQTGIPPPEYAPIIGIRVE